MGLRWEKSYPFGVGVAASAGTLLLTAAQKVDLAQKLANPLLNILAIDVGFMAAALTILLTAQGLKIIRKLKSTQHFRLLVNYHWSAVDLGFLSALASLSVLMVCTSVDGWYRLALFHTWIGLVVWAFMAFYRAVRLLKTLLIAES